MSDSGRSTTYASGHSGHSEGEKSEKETAENKVSTTRRSSSSLGIGSRVARIINATTGAVASAANIKRASLSEKEWFNPEDDIEQKRDWAARQAAQSTSQSSSFANRDSGILAASDRMYEHFCIVGLPPDINISEVSADIRTFNNAKQSLDAGVDSITPDLSTGNGAKQYGLRGPRLPAEVLYSYPDPLPDHMAESIAAFCHPHGIRPELIERTPSMSSYNEILYSQHHRNEPNHSFVFLMQSNATGSSDPKPLYGVCVLTQEFVHRQPALVKGQHLDKWSHLTKYYITAPRCYCLLSTYPFFSLHFSVLHSIIGLERLDRMASLVEESESESFEKSRKGDVDANEECFESPDYDIAFCSSSSEDEVSASSKEFSSPFKTPQKEALHEKDDGISSETNDGDLKAVSQEIQTESDMTPIGDHSPSDKETLLDTIDRKMRSGYKKIISKAAGAEGIGLLASDSSPSCGSFSNTEQTGTASDFSRAQSTPYFTPAQGLAAQNISELEPYSKVRAEAELLTSLFNADDQLEDDTENAVVTRNASSDQVLESVGSDYKDRMHTLQCRLDDSMVYLDNALSRSPNFLEEESNSFGNVYLDGNVLSKSEMNDNDVEQLSTIEAGISASLKSQSLQMGEWVAASEELNEKGTTSLNFMHQTKISTAVLDLEKFDGSGISTAVAELEKLNVAEKAANESREENESIGIDYTKTASDGKLSHSEPASLDMDRDRNRISTFKDEYRDLDAERILDAYLNTSVPSPGQSLRFQPDPVFHSLEFQRPESIQTLLQMGLKLDEHGMRHLDAVHNLGSWAVAALCKSLSLDSVLMFITAALLEQQIVIFCPNIGSLTASVLAIIPLLYPFSWQSLLLPVLPMTPSHLDLLEAPVPFILGAVFKTQEVRARCNGLVRVNAYKNKVRNVGNLPSLPQASALSDALAGPYTALRKAGRDVRADNRPVHEITEAQSAAATAFTATMQTYLRSLVADLKGYTITDVSASSETERVSVLLKESFIESFPPRDRVFMRQFSETQMFTVYCDTVI